MEWIGIVLLAAALSIDAVSIGASCSFSGIRIECLPRIVMHLTSFLCTSLAVALGWVLHGTPAGKVAACIGAGVLCLAGLFLIVGAVRSRTKRDKQQKSGLDKKQKTATKPAEKLTIRASVLLGLMLSADSFAAGLSMEPGPQGVLLPVLCGAFQIVLLVTGEKCALLLRRTAAAADIGTATAGVVLIVSGIFRLL